MLCISVMISYYLHRLINYNKSATRSKLIPAFEYLRDGWTVVFFAFLLRNLLHALLRCFRMLSVYATFLKYLYTKSETVDFCSQHRKKPCSLFLLFLFHRVKKERAHVPSYIRKHNKTKTRNDHACHYVTALHEQAFASAARQAMFSLTRLRNAKINRKIAIR